MSIMLTKKTRFLHFFAILFFELSLCSNQLRYARGSEPKFEPLGKSCQWSQEKWYILFYFSFCFLWVECDEFVRELGFELSAFCLFCYFNRAFVILCFVGSLTLTAFDSSNFAALSIVEFCTFFTVCFGLVLFSMMSVSRTGYIPYNRTFRTWNYRQLHFNFNTIWYLSFITNSFVPITFKLLIQQCFNLLCFLFCVFGDSSLLFSLLTFPLFQCIINFRGG